MRRIAIQRMVPALVMTGVTVVQVVDPVGTTHASASALHTTRTFKGPTEITRHGPVQVSILVKNKKIAKVAATIAPIDDGRSPFLQNRAIPVMKEETLHAQSAKIDVVSGATETSDAYIQSLQAAIKQARKVKALR